MIIEESLTEQQIPNIITADSDGINDTLNLNLWFDKCLEYRIQIYNRWGNQVYEFTNDSVPFTGVDATGKELVAGIYFYKVSSGSDIRHGHITLIR
jgi:gliding motility-associated-like protein